MSKRIYPRKVWVLMPSFKPVEIEVVKPYGARASKDFGDLTEKGKLYGLAQMHDTKADAISIGYAECDRMRENIRKTQDKLCIRLAALEKAEQKP